MKKHFFLISLTGLLIFFTFQLSAQVSISTDAAGADNSAMLDIRPPVPKGVLFPRLTVEQMQAIVNPTNGLLLFCITDNKFYTYIAAENRWRDLIYGADSINLLPMTAPVTWLPGIQSTPGTIISVPVKVTGFINIGAVSLTMLFDTAVLTYIEGINSSGFPGMQSNNALPGKIALGGTTTGDGITLPNNSTLYTINFLYKGGSTQMTWWDYGPSCEYTGPPGYPVLPDIPQDTYYINGSVGPVNQP